MSSQTFSTVIFASLCLVVSLSLHSFLSFFEYPLSPPFARTRSRVWKALRDMRSTSKSRWRSDLLLQEIHTQFSGKSTFSNQMVTDIVVTTKKLTASSFRLKCPSTSKAQAQCCDVRFLSKISHKSRHFEPDKDCTERRNNQNAICSV